MRIDKYISNAGYGTRKEIKQLIKNKKVFLNENLVINSDIKINIETDKVFLNNDLVEYKEFYYLIINKPSGIISATKDEIYNDKTVIDLLGERYKQIGIFLVGRLDKDTEGLLILTNDGKFAHNTLSPKKKVKKIYYAKINGYINNEAIKKFKEGIILEDNYKCASSDLEILNSSKENNVSEIKLTITEGKFHQVKRMFLAINCEVTYLKRIMFGNIFLDDNLKLGEYRELNKKEMEILKPYMS